MTTTLIDIVQMFLCLNTTNIVFLFCDQSPADLWTVIAPAFSTHPQQLINIDLITEFQYNEYKLPMQMSMLFISLVGPFNKFKTNLWTFETFFEFNVPNYYAHNHLVLLPVHTDDGQINREHSRELNDAFAPQNDGGTYVATYHLDSIVKTTILTEQNSQESLRRRCDPLEQRLRRLRNRQPVHVDYLIYAGYGVPVMDQRLPPFSFDEVTGTASERTFIETIEHYLDTCVALFATGYRIQPLWSGKSGCNATLYPRRPGAIKGHLHRDYNNRYSVADPTQLGRRTFMLLVPNWWRQQRVTTTSEETRRKQAFYVLGLSASLFVVLVSRRWLSASRRRRLSAAQTLSDLSCDTWARALLVGVPERRGWRSRGGRWLGFVATVWGLLNGAAMTGVVFDVSLNTVWMPVFGRLADVWQHDWLRVVFDKYQIRLGLLSSVRMPGGLNVSRTDTVTVTEMMVMLAKRRVAAFVIPDDVPIDSLRMAIEHEQNGSAVYRVIRDPERSFNARICITARTYRLTTFNTFEQCV